MELTLFAKKVITAVDNDGRDTGPYLIRWAITTPFFGIKLHHILRSDEDRDLHDHPWSFLSLILRGGYWEHQAIDPAEDPRHDLRYMNRSPLTYRVWYGPGSILWRPAPSPHRLELPAGRSAWSLVITGPKQREWGFRTICGWIPWTEYWRVKREGC
jgi:hypothetical protein